MNSGVGGPVAERLGAAVGDVGERVDRAERPARVPSSSIASFAST